jgi:hypothetical protein
MNDREIAEELIKIANLLVAKGRFTKQEWKTYKKKHPKADPRNFVIEDKKETRDRGDKDDERTQAEARLAPKIKRFRDLRKKKEMGQKLTINEMKEMKRLYTELSNEFKRFGLSMDLLNVS